MAASHQGRSPLTPFVDRVLISSDVVARNPAVDGQSHAYIDRIVLLIQRENVGNAALALCGSLGQDSFDRGVGHVADGGTSYANNLWP